MKRWIPVMVGLTTAVTVIQQEMRLMPTLQASNDAIAAIQSALVIWNRQTIVGRRTGYTRELIVDAVESAVLGVVVGETGSLPVSGSSLPPQLPRSPGIIPESASG